MLNVSALKSSFYVSNFTISGTIYQDEIMYTFGKEHESLQIKRENELYRNTIVVYLRKM
jgi:hypothetical protein